MIYLSDTDTINYLIKNIAVVQNHYQAAIRAGDSFILSLMVEYQVTRYHTLKGVTNLQQRTGMMSHAKRALTLRELLALGSECLDS